jgi:uncharacterized protein (TIGR02270 family)
MLESALDDPDAGLRARARRAVGLLKRADLRPALAALPADPDPACRFWAVWSAVMLGDQGGLPGLLDVAATDQPWAGRALQLALRAMPPASGMGWLRSLSGDPAHRRRVVIGTGIIGDPVCMPWLFQKMAEPALARVAGEAFSAITGVDIAYADLDQDAPADFQAGPTENPEDEDVGRDPDEDLPWPNPDAVSAWWHANGSRFPTGQRYLLGEPMTNENLRAALRTGTQRQRATAALEIALRNPAEKLFETGAPARRQQQALGIIRAK